MNGTNVLKRDQWITVSASSHFPPNALNALKQGRFIFTDLPQNALLALAVAPLVELELDLEALNPEGVRSLCMATWPSLQKLTLHLNPEITFGDLAPLFDGEGVPRLKHLALFDAECMDEVCNSLPDSALGQRLASFDFTTGLLGDTGLNVLTQRRDELRHVEFFPSVETCQDPARLYNVGRILRRLDRTERAVHIFALGIALGPEDVHCDWLELGNALEAQGRLEEAGLAFDKAIAAEPDFYAAWYNKAYLLKKRRRYRDAIKIVETVLKEAGEEDPDYWQLKGFLKRKLGKRPESLEALGRALALYNLELEEDPEQARNLFFRACTLILMGQPDLAVGDLEAAIALDPALREEARVTMDLTDLTSDSRFVTLVLGAKAASKLPLQAKGKANPSVRGPFSGDARVMEHQLQP